MRWDIFLASMVGSLIGFLITPRLIRMIVRIVNR